MQDRVYGSVSKPVWLVGDACTHTKLKRQSINPFTAMNAAQSLGKRPLKGPTFETIKVFFAPFT